MFDFIFILSLMASILWLAIGTAVVTTGFYSPLFALGWAVSVVAIDAAIIVPYANWKRKQHNHEQAGG